MADFEMLGRRNVRIRDYVAAVRERDPHKCWVVQALINYNNFKRLQESTRETITTSEVERTRTSKGKEVESKNPAASNVQRTRKKKGKGVESKNATAIRGSKLERTRKTKGKERESKNPAEFRDDITLGELLQNYKDKKNQKALQVEEARLLATSSPAGSYGGLSGFKLPGSLSRVHEPMVGVGVDNGKEKAFDVEESRFFLTKSPPAGSYGGLSCLKPWNHEVLACSVNTNPAEFSTETAKRFMRRI